MRIYSAGSGQPGLHKKQQRVENTNTSTYYVQRLHILPHLKDTTPTVGREEYYREGESQRSLINSPNDTRANQWQRQCPHVTPFSLNSTVFPSVNSSEVSAKFSIPLISYPFCLFSYQVLLMFTCLK